MTHYINIVERSFRTKSTRVAKDQEIEDNKKTVEVICKWFAHHKDIKAIKGNNIEKISQRKTAAFRRFLLVTKSNC